MITAKRFKDDQEQGSSEPPGLSFFDHLEELRRCLLKSGLVFILASFFAYYFTPAIVDFLIKPVGRLAFTSPADAFAAYMSVTFLGGFLISFPFILYQVWYFVAGALKEEEKRHIIFFAPASCVLFVLGGVFAYYVVIPVSIQFLMGFASENMVPMITVDNYISYVGSLLVGCGVTFELPIILYFLAKIGIATPAFLSQKRRYAVIIILVISAVVTPPDVISMLVMTVPLVILYEVGVLVVRATYREKQIL